MTIEEYKMVEEILKELKDINGSLRVVVTEIQEVNKQLKQDSGCINKRSI